MFAVQKNGKSISTEPESVQLSILSHAGSEVTMMTVEEKYTWTLVSCPVQTQYVRVQTEQKTRVATSFVLSPHLWS